MNMISVSPRNLCTAIPVAVLVSRHNTHHPVVWQLIDSGRCEQAAQRIVKESHAKSDCVNGQFLDTPIGKGMVISLDPSVSPFHMKPSSEHETGGKVDDTSVVVGEIIEWTEAHTQIWSEACELSCSRNSCL